MIRKLHFIHRHNVLLSTAKKVNHLCFELNGNEEIKNDSIVDIDNSVIYFSLYCKECKYFLLKPKEIVNFKVTSTKYERLNNYFNQKGEVENVFYADKPNKNLVKDSGYFHWDFYKLTPGPEYDCNTIYVGTEAEQKEFFHRLYIYLRSKILKKEKEIQQNKTNLEEGKKELEKYKSKIHFKQDDDKDDIELKDAYDIIIGINSILSLNKEGWPIKFPKGKENYENKIKKPSIIIGVLGNRNKGKSFILGKLSGYPVPQGFSIKTEGISISFGEKVDHCIAILDSAGQEVPLLSKENKEEEVNNIEADDENNSLDKCLRDKLITEKFIEQFIIHTSDILVLVVGSITLNEQKILERIRKFLQNKFLFVVHNLQNFSTKKQVDDYVENTLKKLYGIKIEENFFQNIKEKNNIENENKFNKIYYVEENNRKITHLIFINDYCDFSEYYNTPTTDFLTKKLEVEQNRTQFSVIEKCKDFFIYIENEFLEENLDRKDFSQDEGKIIIKDKNITLRKVFIDEIGKAVTNDSDIPNYNYYAENNDLIINIELPGDNAEIGSKLNIDGEFYKFSFKGKTAGITSETDKKYLISKNLKKQIPFEFSIRISMKDIHILPNEQNRLQFYSRSKKNEGGLFTFKYHIATKSTSDDYE